VIEVAPFGSVVTDQSKYLQKYYLRIFAGIHTYSNMWWPLLAMATVVLGQNRRPTISFITQPEIVADIGGDVS